jgi:hypothetical protein
VTHKAGSVNLPNGHHTETGGDAEQEVCWVHFSDWFIGRRMVRDSQTWAHAYADEQGGLEPGQSVINQSKMNWAISTLNHLNQQGSWQYTTVFQADVYAIKACADENIKRTCWKRNIYILSDNQALIKALDSCKISSKLDCHQCH